MTIRKETTEDVVLVRKWKTWLFDESTAVNKFFNNPIVTRKGTMGTTEILTGINEKQIQSTIDIGVQGFPYKNPNIGNAKAGGFVATDPEFSEWKVKTMYENRWWGVYGIEQQLMKGIDPTPYMVDVVGNYWVERYNKTIGATLSGIGKLNEITAGTDKIDFKEVTVNKVLSKKKDKGLGRIGTMCMNSTTLYDIISKQDSKVIPVPLITQRFGTVVLTKDDIQRTITSRDGEWVYKGNVPIIVDDEIVDGLISIVSDGTFIFAEKNFTTPLMHRFNYEAGNGVPKEEWGSVKLFIMHPSSFNFVGTSPTQYAAKGAVTDNEFKAGGCYSLATNIKNTKILNVIVKIGV